MWGDNDWPGRGSGGKHNGIPGSRQAWESYLWVLRSGARGIVGSETKGAKLTNVPGTDSAQSRTGVGLGHRRPFWELLPVDPSSRLWPYFPPLNRIHSWTDELGRKQKPRRIDWGRGCRLKIESSEGRRGFSGACMEAWGRYRCKVWRRGESKGVSKGFHSWQWWFCWRTSVMLSNVSQPAGNFRIHKVHKRSAHQQLSSCNHLSLYKFIESWKNEFHCSLNLLSANSIMFLLVT